MLVHVDFATPQLKYHRNTFTMCSVAEPLSETLLLWRLSSWIPGVVPSGIYCVVTQEAAVSVITDGAHEIVV